MQLSSLHYLSSTAQAAFCKTVGFLLPAATLPLYLLLLKDTVEAHINRRHNLNQVQPKELTFSHSLWLTLIVAVIVYPD